MDNDFDQTLISNQLQKFLNKINLTNIKTSMFNDKFYILMEENINTNFTVNCHKSEFKTAIH